MYGAQAPQTEQLAGKKMGYESKYEEMIVQGSKYQMTMKRQRKEKNARTTAVSSRSFLSHPNHSSVASSALFLHSRIKSSFITASDFLLWTTEWPKVSHVTLKWHLLRILTNVDIHIPLTQLLGVYSVGF